MQNGRVSGDRVAICPSGSRVVMYHVKAVVDHLFTANKTRGFAVDLLYFHGKSTIAFVEKPISTERLSRSKPGRGKRQIHER